jgi:hypothetical protein
VGTFQRVSQTVPLLGAATGVRIRRQMDRKECVATQTASLWPSFPLLLLLPTDGTRIMRRRLAHFVSPRPATFGRRCMVLSLERPISAPALPPSPQYHRPTPMPPAHAGRGVFAQPCRRGTHRRRIIRSRAREGVVWC